MTKNRPSIKDWLEGARVRTLPAAIAPILVAAGASWGYTHGHLARTVSPLTPGDGFSWLKLTLCALVAIFFQLGVNFANDYSDGIRGTDKNRTGPLRLTASQKVAPRTVKILAIVMLVLGCVAGVALLALTNKWWLGLFGLGAVWAAWAYTGGKHPYGYLGLGEVFVFLTFGLLATVGTFVTQFSRVPASIWLSASAIGLLACALLMINNIRDMAGDLEAGKRTLAVRLGYYPARMLYVVFLLLPFILANIATYNPVVWILLPITYIWCISPVYKGAIGKEIIIVLKHTALFEIIFALWLALMLAY